MAKKDLGLLCFESKIFLADITNRNYNNGSKNLT
jgi:hypothetical protein